MSSQSQKCSEEVRTKALTAPSDKCPFHKCDGSGRILVEYPAHGFEKDYGYPHIVAHPCECSGKSNSDYRRSRALIPPEYIGKRIVDFDWSIYEKYKCDVSPIKKIVNDFINNYHEYEKKPFGLYLYSKTKGSGKTLLSTIIAEELISRYSVSVKFITVLDFLSMVKKNYKADEYSDDILSLFQTRILILDDIGIEIKKEHTDMILYQLINERCNNHLITLYTSNLSLEELKLDDRIIDRINKTTIVLDIPNVPVRRIRSDEDKMKFLQRKSY